MFGGPERAALRFNATVRGLAQPAGAFPTEGGAKPMNGRNAAGRD
jgi:hypothetical protein